jgi:SSS family solute:Na+ symporter
MNLYAIVLAVIVLTLLTVSIARLGKVKTKADYLVAGRSLPAFVLVFTLLSSWIGSGSLLGGAENAYRHGFVALWQGGGGWAGLLLIYFIAPRARKFAQFTIPDLLEARYNQTARVLGVVAINLSAVATSSTLSSLPSSAPIWVSTSSRPSSLSSPPSRAWVRLLTWML